MASTTTTTTLVVGATGATGKHVTLLLLQQKQCVRAIVRSKQRLLDALEEISPNASEEYKEFLQIEEAAVLDLSDEKLEELCSGCDAIVSCLGHNLTFRGVFGKPRRLVTDAVKRLCNAIETNQFKEKKPKKVKFLLMGSDGVANPSGEDDKRTRGERTLLFFLRYLVPPHRDNETAAAYIHGKMDSPNLFQWVVIRPTDLIDGRVTKYELFHKPPGSLFGDGVATRANVAKSFVDMILTQSLWDEWKFKMPVIHDLE